MILDEENVMNKMVSVIIPVYNTEKFLERCIQSVINQTYCNLEIILINDGSTDNSLNICEKYKQLDKRIGLISGENYGVSHARNMGIERAKGEFLYFIDSDDFLDLDAINKMLHEFEKSNCELVIAAYNEIEDKGKVISRRKKWERLQLKNDEAKSFVLDEDGGGGYLWNKLFKSSIIEKFQIRFDENIYVWEDVLFVMKYLDRCCYINLIDDVVYTYCRREGSAVEYSLYTPKLYTQVDAIEKIEKLIYLDNSTKELLLYRKFRCCLGLIRSMALSVNIEKDKLVEIVNRLKSIRVASKRKISLTDKVSFILIRIHPMLFAYVYRLLHRIVKIKCLCIRYFSINGCEERKVLKERGE